MTNNRILIIGYGTVGRNLEKEIKNCGLLIDVVDKFKKSFTTKKEGIKYKFGFICVDTPLTYSKDWLDISEVRNAINDNDCEIYIIKSTCNLGTVDLLKSETGKRIIFSPEYYGGTQHCNNFNFDFTILGGEKKDCLEVVQLLQNVYDGRHTFRITDSKTAELVKFMENSWLAYKVSFCIDFYELCKKHGLNYEELRELFVLDPRVNPSHTFVYEDHPYFCSHCLNKDVPAIANHEGIESLKTILKENKKRKNYIKS